jgi:hypothetical protein
MNRQYYIYIITNILTDKSYVGFKMYDTEKEGKEYMGSSKYLNADILKYGQENFVKIKLKENIIFIDKEEQAKIESYFINLYNTLSPNGYNRYDPGKLPKFCVTGFHRRHKPRKHPMSEEDKQKRRGPRGPHKPRAD